MNNTTCPNIYEYKCHDKGLLMPFVNEYTWPLAARGTIYLLGLFWCFLGVAIVADVFMCAIEKITSKTRIIKVANPSAPEGVEDIEVKVWNDTVANLTLMALGSSAPEILLSCIEIIVKNKFKAGELGPGTIVGSAAFNLLVIIAVCVMAIPSQDIRRVKSIKVFAVTAFFSIFAYIWLIIILVLITPNYVDLWEAIITLLFFPILVILAYVADKDFCNPKKVDDSQLEIGFEDKAHMTLADGKVDESSVREFLKEIGKHPELTEEDAAKLAAAKISENAHHNRLWYRINATRAMTGGHKLVPSMSETLHKLYSKVDARDKEFGSCETNLSMVDLSENNSKAVIEFTATQCSIMESDKRVKLHIKRYGKMTNQVLVKVETIDGTAEATKDYIPIKLTVVFGPNEVSKTVDIEIIDDNEWEPDEIFFCKLTVDPKQEAVLGKKNINQITIINDDEPGTIEFAKPSLLFKESAGKALIPIDRTNGCDGRITISWRTEDMSAKSGQDYEGGEGTIVFEHGETTKMLEILIIDDQEAEKDETFKVELVEASGGAKIGRIKKTIITIVNDDDFNGMVSRLVDMTNMNMDSLRVETTTYADQFRNAMNVNGGDLECASNMDYVLHFLTFGWKLIFALIPPPSVLGGWLCFTIALAMIGFLTAIIGDLASIFGCIVGLYDPVTAITFVALGTSLPDLFASKVAATQERHADNSIGNVTGSNSVNVFLGLGLPWTIAAIYWTAQGKSFRVEAGSLAFSVAIYAICAGICLALLLVRRFISFFGKGELGGPDIPKYATGCFLIFLWFVYIILSSLQTYGHIKVNF